MKTKIKYTDEPLGEFRIIDDFLPPPEQLILNEKEVEVRFKLSERSLEFFKQKSKLSGTPYQKMIRQLLELYTLKYR